MAGILQAVLFHVFPESIDDVEIRPVEWEIEAI